MFQNIENAKATLNLRITYYYDLILRISEFMIFDVVDKNPSKITALSSVNRLSALFLNRTYIRLPLDGKPIGHSNDY